ncbi:hypothetical protein P154DRAFT_451772 [Amniculicola lignicola CBS 123094]|uniref:Signal peptide-containing protein n=1 Tax=Amniculicola lignicola CBS 123094 TaxID=1392246 RepID=A0A6A5VVU5_9PLEO|nr:hypothetical protein P154DRAFT_451772 [Amniculicola lignicola CBS 123094]
MSWLWRGIQSAIFHYASCAPCTGYMYRNKRRKDAKRDRKLRAKMQMEHPDMYHHPEPTGTNPYWTEEIVMGPGPPPRRARRTNTTGSQRAITRTETFDTALSNGGSSIDVDHADDPMRMSDDTLDDDNWNRKRYQREDEDLWGVDEPLRGSSVGVGGVVRPGTSKSSADSYYTARAPPVNDLHPPVVSLPSPRPADNRWMLQPPPKASVMSGKERATHRSRSGSGASSRVELSLQRQVSARHLKARIERGETPDLPPISRGSSCVNFHSTSGPPPQPRAVSAASSRRKRRRDTVLTPKIELEHSSGDSSDTVIHGMKTAPSPAQASGMPSLKIVRVRSTRQLSTVLSDGGPSPPHPTLTSSIENELPDLPPPVKPREKQHRAPLSSSDVSSLNVLQDLVSPRALLNSQFVSAPLIEAHIRLPPTNMDEEKMLTMPKDVTSSGFGISRGWDTEQMDGEARVPFDSLGAQERDPRMRWSVDF